MGAKQRERSEKVRVPVPPLTLKNLLSFRILLQSLSEKKTAWLPIKRRPMAYYPSQTSVVSFAAVFRLVTQRSSLPLDKGFFSARFQSAVQNFWSRDDIFLAALRFPKYWSRDVRLSAFIKFICKVFANSRATKTLSRDQSFWTAHWTNGP